MTENSRTLAAIRGQLAKFSGIVMPRFSEAGEAVKMDSTLPHIVSNA